MRIQCVTLILASLCTCSIACGSATSLDDSNLFPNMQPPSSLNTPKESEADGSEPPAVAPMPSDDSTNNDSIVDAALVDVVDSNAPDVLLPGCGPTTPPNRF